MDLFILGLGLFIFALSLFILALDLLYQTPVLHHQFLFSRHTANESSDSVRRGGRTWRTTNPDGSRAHPVHTFRAARNHANRECSSTVKQTSEIRSAEELYHYFECLGSSAIEGPHQFVHWLSESQKRRLRLRRAHHWVSESQKRRLRLRRAHKPAKLINPTPLRRKKRAGVDSPRCQEHCPRASLSFLLQSFDNDC